VRVEEFDPAVLSTSFVTFSEAVSPSEGTSVRFTFPAKLCRLVNVSFAVPELVALIVTVVGADEIEKSSTGTIRWTITKFDGRPTLVAVTVTL
jgi:hypothetical protein